MNLDFMKGVVRINGYLHVEHCSQLTNIAGLSSLRLVKGAVASGVHGLVLQNNNLLQDLKSLEGIESVASGGVSISVLIASSQQPLAFKDSVHLVSRSCWLTTVLSTGVDTKQPTTVLCSSLPVGKSCSLKRRRGWIVDCRI